ncbi:TauD/TfdA dioxygenase family protein [Candidatus Poriferisocius sp.]|uniref:TauD/TfdA dioxygenase family protein n=1 Tax=Candidatus Poriferisocius sp. TaxID=3101276 RepID=UPI003B019D64
MRGTSVGEQMTGLDIRPLTSDIGAEIIGVDLRDELDDAVVGTIRRALLDHLVVFFRDQDITPDQHLAFAGRFGSINVAPFGPKLETHPAITVLDQIAPVGGLAARWHSDNTYMPNPPLGSILRAVELPDIGGDTCFANMYRAYEELSGPMRLLVDGLEAAHDLTYTLTRAIDEGLAREHLDTMRAQYPELIRPVVRIHPETGRKALFVNSNFTTRLVGLTEAENDSLLPLLLNHVRSPDFQCRFRWATNSIAFWDNRSVQHYAVPDYTQRRVMHRVTIDEGD